VSIVQAFSDLDRPFSEDLWRFATKVAAVRLREDEVAMAEFEFRLWRLLSERPRREGALARLRERGPLTELRLARYFRGVARHAAAHAAGVRKRADRILEIASESPIIIVTPAPDAILQAERTYADVFAAIERAIARAGARPRWSAVRVRVSFDEMRALKLGERSMVEVLGMTSTEAEADPLSFIQRRSALYKSHERAREALVAAVRADPVCDVSTGRLVVDLLEGLVRRDVRSTVARPSASREVPMGDVRWRADLPPTRFDGEGQSSMFGLDLCEYFDDRFPYEVAAAGWRFDRASGAAVWRVPARLCGALGIALPLEPTLALVDARSGPVVLWLPEGGAVVLADGAFGLDSEAPIPLRAMLSPHTRVDEAALVELIAASTSRAIEDRLAAVGAAMARARPADTSDAGLSAAHADGFGARAVAWAGRLPAADLASLVATSEGARRIAADRLASAGESASAEVRAAHDHWAAVLRPISFRPDAAASLRAWASLPSTADDELAEEAG
jgi:hypothetical protein